MEETRTQQTMPEQGFTFNPKIPIEIICVNPEKQQYKFDFGKFTTRARSFKKYGSKKLFSEFINDLYEHSVNFKEEIRIVFHPKNNPSFSFSFMRDGDDNPAMRITYTEYELTAKGNKKGAIKGKNFSKKSVKGYDAYRFLVEKYNIPVPTELSFEEMMEKDSIYYLYCEFGNDGDFLQINKQGDGCVKKLDWEFGKAIKILAYVMLEDVNEDMISIYENMDTETLNNLKLAFKNGKLGYSFKKQIEHNTQYAILVKPLQNYYNKYLRRE